MLIKITSKNTPATVRGLEKVRDYLAKAEFSKGPAQKAGKIAIDAIKSRTAKAIGLDRAPFEGLVKEYADRKYRKTGKRIPDLRFSGDMMRSMRMWVSRPGRDVRIRIGFSDDKQARKAKLLEEGVPPTGEGLGMPARKFMGLTRGEEFRVRNKMKDEILREMNKLRKGA